MYRFWDGQSWSEQTTSDPSAPPPGPAGPPPPAPPTQVAPGQYGGQDPYQQQYGQQQYGQQSPYTQPQPGQYGGGGSGGGTGKRVALIALAVLLIAGLAAGGFFGVRALTEDDDNGGTASDDSSETTDEAEDTESPTDDTESPTDPTTEPTESNEPTGPTGKECTGGLPNIGGETTRRGRIEGGDLVLPPVDGYSPVEPQLASVFTFADEVAATYQQIEENWIAMYAVGALPKANGYTDLEASADQVITCMSESPNFYNGFQERNDLDREEIDVDGHSAYSVTAEIRVDSPDVQVDGDVARVIVVDTGDEEHFGVFISVVPIGDQGLIDQQDTASQELKVAD